MFWKTFPIVFPVLISSLSTLVLTTDTLKAISNANSPVAARDASFSPKQLSPGPRQSSENSEQQAIMSLRALSDSAHSSGDLKLEDNQVKRAAPRFFGKREDPTTYVAFQTWGQPLFLTSRNLDKDFDVQEIDTRAAPRFFGKRGSPRFFGKRGSPRFFGKREMDEEPSIETRGSPRFFGKRSTDDQTASSENGHHRISKRDTRSIGKRWVQRRDGYYVLGRPFLSRREFLAHYRRSSPQFIGKRAMEQFEGVSEPDQSYEYLKRGIPRFVGKRGIPRFVGKRADLEEENSPEVEELEKQLLEKMTRILENERQSEDEAYLK